MRLDQLLRALEVRIDNFFICQACPGWRLAFDAEPAETVHYVLSGEGVLKTPDAPPLPLRRDCFVILPGGLAHSFSPMASGARTYRSRNPASSPGDEVPVIRAGDGDACLTTACGTVRTTTYGGAVGLFARLKTPIVENLDDEESLCAQFERVLREMATSTVGMRAMTESLLKQCLIVLLRRHLGSDRIVDWLAPLRDERLTDVIAAMLERPADAFTLDDLAGIAGMSRAAFAGHFAATFGQSPFAFLTEVRLRRAARLLETTDVPIKAIAAMVGYASRSYFSRAFARLFGVDPTTFRSRDTGCRPHGAAVADRAGLKRPRSR